MTQYHCKCLTTETDDLIAYWPLWEASGDAAEDISGHNSHGLYTAVTLGQPGIGDGKTCPSFDGANSFVNIYSDELERNFDPAEFTFLIWLKVANEAVWSDATQRMAMSLRVDSSTYARIGKSTTAANLFGALFSTGAQSINTTLNSGVQFIPMVMTASASGNFFRLYRRGILRLSIAHPGAWVGAISPTGCCIGATTTTPASPWSGSLAHAAIWSKALSDAHAAYLSRYW